MMLMTIRYQSGHRAEAVVLTANRERMRVAIDSHPDTMELQRVEACWHMEDGFEIEIEALIPISETDASGFRAAICPLANTAGQSLMFA
jgi:hypothetical protein